jgi:ketosteroid isomerase-like protein
MDERNRELVKRFMAANGAGDLDEVGRCLHADMVMEWPQSGERFVGREQALGAMRAQEQMPAMGAEPRIVGSGDVWVAMVPLRYGDDIYHYVAVLELTDGLVRRGTGFWGAPFPAQPSRAAFAEG